MPRIRAVYSAYHREEEEEEEEEEWPWQDVKEEGEKEEGKAYEGKMSVPPTG